LVRDSADPRYLYALSIQTERGPTSVRIHYTEGCFRLDADSLLAERLPKFRSVPDLIDFYVSQWKRCREHGQVSHPLPAMSRENLTGTFWNRFGWITADRSTQTWCCTRL
jgi:hypothetical protein